MATAVKVPDDLKGDAEFPFAFEIVDVKLMFTDSSYQRPLTSFVDKIKRGFDPALFNTVILSYRDSGRQEGKYALVDGQTRAVAVNELLEDGESVPRGLPSLVYYSLTRQQEASLFGRLQKERRGIASYHRFRAALVAGEKEPKAITRIVESAGYTIGVNAKEEISAVAALEKVYRTSPDMLERVVIILSEAWGDRHMPNGEVLRGLSYFLNHNDSIDDDRLARRLSTNTPATLKRKSSALREGMGHGGGSDKYMAGAIEGVYRSRG